MRCAPSCTGKSYNTLDKISETTIRYGRVCQLVLAGLICHGHVIHHV